MRRSQNPPPRALPLAAVLLFYLSGCAGVPAATGRAVETPRGELSIRLEALNFGYKPNTVRTIAGKTLTIEVTNISRLRHNLTIVRPDGRVLLSESLPAGQTVRVRFTPPAPGRYPFYCDVFGHRTLGMRGAIVAE